MAIGVTGCRRVVLATGNPGKLREFQGLLGSVFELVAQTELNISAVEETGDSFAENALLKACHASAASGMPAIADDSGLEVDALDGAPGIRSARYAGVGASDDDNNNKLLRALGTRPAPERGARFPCVIAYVRSPDDPEPLFAEDVWEGSILTAPRGSGGFGYDPLFLDEATGLTGGELEPDDKNSRSHRGKAARRLRELLDSDEVVSNLD